MDRMFLELFFVFILLIIVLTDIWRKIKRRNRILLPDFVIWFTCLAFGTTPLMVLYYGGTLPLVENAVVIYTYSGIILFLAGLFFSRYFSPLRKELRNNELSPLGLVLKSAADIKQYHIIILYLFVLLMRYIYLTEYNIFASGTATKERVEAVPYFMFVLRSFSNIILFGCILWAVCIIFINRKLSLFPVFILLVEFGIAFFYGRRWMIFFIILFAIVFFVLNVKVKANVVIPIIATAFLLVTVLFPFYISFRDFYLRKAQSGDIVSDMQYSYRETTSSRDLRIEYEANITQRAYIIGWNMDIIKRNELYDGLKGEALLANIFWAIPSTFFPGKYSSVDPETFVNLSLGLPNVDSSSNWAGFGFADFGMIGGFIAGLFYGLILIFVETFAYRLKDKLSTNSFLIVSAFIFVVYSVEELPTAVFTMIRDSFFLVLFFYLFEKFSQAFMKRKKVYT